MSYTAQEQAMMRLYNKLGSIAYDIEHKKQGWNCETVAYLVRKIREQLPDIIEGRVNDPVFLSKYLTEEDDCST